MHAAYPIVLFLKFQFLKLHNLHQGLECHHHIRIDNRAILPSLVFWETARMNDPHLLDYSGLPRLSRTWRKIM